MPDFSKLLKRPAGKAKPPVALPVGDYMGIIFRTPEVGETSQKKTPYMRFPVRLTAWPEELDEEYKFEEDADGNRKPIDLGKKDMRRDMFLTDDALYMLDELFASMGLDVEGKTYEELMPMCLGKHVKVTIEQYIPQGAEDGTVRANIRRIKGIDGEA